MDLRAAQAERDEGPAGAGQGAKPSVTSRAMGTSFLGCGAALERADVKGRGVGTAEKLAGKITKDPGKQARGEERKVILSKRLRRPSTTD